MSEKVFELFGSCPYCGQVCNVSMDVESPTQEQLTAAAVEICTCYEAKKEVETKKRLEDAKLTISLMFSADEEAGLRDMIYKTVELIVQHRIASVQINMGFGRNIKIKDKRDNVQIVEISREANVEEV